MSFRQKQPQMYHHYEGAECVARFIMHEDGGGVWFTGPIRLTGYEKRGGAEVPKWDDSAKDEIFIHRMPTEAQAVNAIRRKLGAPPVGVGAGEGWGDTDKKKAGVILT